MVFFRVVSWRRLVVGNVLFEFGVLCCVFDSACDCLCVYAGVYVCPSHTLISVLQSSEIRQLCVWVCVCVLFTCVCAVCVCCVCVPVCACVPVCTFARAFVYECGKYCVPTFKGTNSRGCGLVGHFLLISVYNSRLFLLASFIQSVPSLKTASAFAKVDSISAGVCMTFSVCVCLCVQRPWRIALALFMLVCACECACVCLCVSNGHNAAHLHSYPHILSPCAY